jgi:protein-S-isoprenylcysteine O-methyltransferase Ste14
MATLRAIIGDIGYVMLFAVFLFVPAGTFNWRRAWVFLGVLFVARIVSTLSVMRVNKAVLIERAKLPMQKGQPLGDKLLLISFMATFAGLVEFTSFDRFRFHLLPQPPAVVSLAGLLFCMIGWWIIALVLRTNAFAAMVVRHQQERAHTVVDTGVYAVVRHPMYSGLILVLVGMCLWLESTAGVLLASIPLGILVVRIFLEERFLRRDLQGYDAYAARVQRRLIPGLW